MKKILLQDERVKEQKRKIASEAFSFVMLFLIGATLVKQFVFNADFSEYAVEFFAFFGASFYIVIRNIAVGNNLFRIDKHNKGMIIINSLVTGITITVVTAFLHFNEYDNYQGLMVTLLVAFTIATLASAVVFFALSKLSQRQVKRLEKRFDDENFE